MSKTDASSVPSVALEVGGRALVVSEVAAREALHELYRFEVTLPVAFADEAVAPGVPGTLCTTSPEGHEHRRRGLVVGVDVTTVVGADDPRPGFEMRVTLRPAAWRLTQRRNTRIFQDVAIREVITMLFDEHRVPCRWLAEGLDRPRDYIVQYEETDWDFVRRLLAEAGAMFFFAAAERTPVDGPTGENPFDVIVVASSAYHYPPVVEGELTLPFRPGGAALRAASCITEATFRRRSPAPRVVARGYDHRQPHRIIQHQNRASDADGAGEFFTHHAPFDDDVDASLARLAATQREQLERDVRAAVVTANDPRLRAGHTLALAEHPDPALNRRWVVVGSDVSLSGAAGTFRLTSHLVPDDVPYRPEVPRRRVVQVAESATVVGPADAVIHTDPMGRVRVRFHWDRRAATPEHASCWVRPLQQWTGPHWGAQHIPRIGSEVAVGFMGGDPDQPFLLGQLRNPIQPPPFELPEAKTRSGWRTQSVPGGGGHELSFQDAAGGEEVYLHSQGALREHVTTFHETEVDGDREATVHGATHESFVGPVTRDYAAPVVATHHQPRTTQLEQDDALIVAGNRQADLQGHVRTTVGGQVDLEVAGVSRVRLGSDHRLEGEGSVMIAAGTKEAPRSIDLDALGSVSIAGSHAVTVESTQEITFRVGESELTLGPNEIRLRAPTLHLETNRAQITLDDDVVAAGATVSLKGGEVWLASTQGASVGLTSEAAVDGAQILLNSPVEALDPVATAPEPNTTMSLVDEDGAPCAHRPFVLEMASGRRRSGRLNADGVFSCHLDEDATVSFPGVAFAEDLEAVPDGHRRHGVKPGEDLQTLSDLYGVPPTLIRDDPENEALWAQMRDPYVLCPGDEVAVPYLTPSRHPLVRESDNAFVGEVMPTVVEVEIVVEGRPLAHHRCAVWAAGDPYYALTDGDGVLKIDHATVRRVVVHPAGHEPLALEIGDLDPATTTRGLQSRLRSLGHLLEEWSGVAGVHTIRALYEFATAEGISEEDLLGEDLILGLIERHSC